MGSFNTRTDETPGKRIATTGSLAVRICFLFVLFLCGSPAYAGNASLEYQVKASLIFNFLQFIQWPPDDIQRSPETLRLCIAGPDRFGGALAQIEGEIAQGRRLKVARYPSPSGEELKGCQAIFIGSGAPGDIEQLLAELRDTTAVTIGEAPDFLDHGGMINLLIEGDRVVFEISRAAAVQARMVISSKLLQIARAVRD